MPYSRANKIKSEKYNNNITRRGLVGAEIAKVIINKINMINYL